MQGYIRAKRSTEKAHWPSATTTEVLISYRILHRARSLWTRSHSVKSLFYALCNVANTHSCFLPRRVCVFLDKFHRPLLIWKCHPKEAPWKWRFKRSQKEMNSKPHLSKLCSHKFLKSFTVLIHSLQSISNEFCQISFSMQINTVCLLWLQLISFTISEHVRLPILRVLFEIHLSFYSVDLL